MPLTSRPTRPATGSTNFSAKPTRGLTHDACRADAIDVDVDAGTRLLGGRLDAAGVIQALAILDARFVVPVYWETV